MGQPESVGSIKRLGLLLLGFASRLARGGHQPFRFSLFLLANVLSDDLLLDDTGAKDLDGDR